MVLKGRASDFALQRCLAMTGDLFGCHHWAHITGIYRGKARDAANRAIIHRTGPHDTELPSLHVSMPQWRNSGLRRAGVENMFRLDLVGIFI